MSENMQHETQPIPETEEEWRRRLTPRAVRGPAQQGHGTRRSPVRTRRRRSRASTDVPGAAPQLFSSETKFESGTGWPSFWEPIEPGAVALHEDREPRDATHRGHLRALRRPPGTSCSPMVRGPPGDRYCMNSVSLDLDTASPPVD